MGQGDTVDNPSLAIRLLRKIVKAGLHIFWRFKRGLTLGVRVAVLDDQERIFLIRHTYLPGWYLPGGGVESGETVEEALTRELREEGNIEITGKPLLHGVFFNRHVSKRDHVLIYVVRDFRVIAPKKPDREIAEAGFFPINALPESTTPATRRRLAEILGKIPATSMW
ncbi:NUDIX domain-containing protein [Hohaiivirga grylli]